MIAKQPAGDITTDGPRNSRPKQPHNPLLDVPKIQKLDAELGTIDRSTGKRYLFDTISARCRRTNVRIKVNVFYKAPKEFIATTSYQGVVFRENRSKPSTAIDMILWRVRTANLKEFPHQRIETFLRSKAHPEDGWEAVWISDGIRRFRAFGDTEFEAVCRLEKLLNDSGVYVER